MISWLECCGPATRLSIMVGSVVEEDAQIIAVERQRGWEEEGGRIGGNRGGERVQAGSMITLEGMILLSFFL